MTEYAMILATIAIVCLAAYQIMGTDINGMLSSVDTLLQTALRPIELAHGPNDER